MVPGAEGPTSSDVGPSVCLGVRVSVCLGVGVSSGRIGIGDCQGTLEGGAHMLGGETFGAVCVARKHCSQDLCVGVAEFLLMSADGSAEQPLDLQV